MARQVADRGSKSLNKGTKGPNTGEQREHRLCGVSGTEGCPGATKEAEDSREMSGDKVSDVSGRVWLALVCHE